MLNKNNIKNNFGIYIVASNYKTWNFIIIVIEEEIIKKIKKDYHRPCVICQCLLGKSVNLRHDNNEEEAFFIFAKYFSEIYDGIHDTYKNYSNQELDENLFLDEEDSPKILIKIKCDMCKNLLNGSYVSQLIFNNEFWSVCWNCIKAFNLNSIQYFHTYCPNVIGPLEDKFQRHFKRNGISHLI